MIPIKLKQEKATRSGEFAFNRCLRALSHAHFLEPVLPTDNT